MNIIEAENIGLKIKTNRNLKAVLTDFFSNKSKNANETWLLKGINLKVRKGEVLGIIGRSGSGKSVLLQVISGLYSPDNGSLKVHGTISRLLTSTSGFQRGLSGLENIYYYGKLTGLKKNQIDLLIKDITGLADIGDFIYRPVRTYFSDMLARLGFAITVSFQRDIIIIDEALEAGDTGFKNNSRRKLEALITGGQTVLLISHHMETIRRFANKVIWIDNGELIAQGSAEELCYQYRQNRSASY